MTLTQIIGAYLVVLCLCVLALQGLVSLRDVRRRHRVRQECDRMARERDDELALWREGW
jgi:hypothetical protein